MDKLEDYPAPKYLNQHHWTDHEKIFKRKHRIQVEICELVIPLRSGLLYKLSKSIIGPFLEELNSSQSQDQFLNENKFQILNWHLKNYSEHDKEIVKKRNLFIRDYYGLLKKAVDGGLRVNLSFLETYLRSLSLDCCFIKSIDNTLKKFKDLQILTLSGNFLRDVSGTFLPRKLLILDLFDNFIGDVANLVRNAPKSIQSLGLARNRLKDDSNLHLLAKSGNFPRLKNIDLSDNDICDLPGLIKSLKRMESITALSLQGNPCWVIPQYKEIILSNLTNLQYLDSTEILDEDRSFRKNKENGGPRIVFQCFRILGLPEPPKDKKNKQTIHIEINLPLLIPNPLKDAPAVNKERDNETVSTSTKTETISVQSEPNKKSKKDPKSHKDKHSLKEKSDKKSKEEKKPKKKSLYAGLNEYSEEEEKSNTWLKSEEKVWEKMLEFATISVPDEDLFKIRDSFRSIVPVRIVYLKVAPYNPKQKKPKPKTPKKDKQNNKKRKSGSAAEELESNIESISLKEEQKDQIVSRVILGSFYCELKSVNWSDETLDFYWAQHVDFGDKAVCVDGSLKAIDYDLNAIGSKKNKNPHGDPKSEEEGHHQKEFLPNVLTCQVGFGLERNK